MRGLNHLVLTGHDLEAMGDRYAALGFTLAPRGRHPFGTDNIVIQFHGCYLELLAVARPQDVPEHGLKSFSFAAFNCDYLARHEGFAMVVFDTADASADIAAWQEAGLKTYEPFDFQRAAKLPSGEEITVSFSLAFSSTPQAPWIGVFACQNYRPDYYMQERYLAHPNTAQNIREVWISGDGALGLAVFMAKLTGIAGEKHGADKTVFTTRSGDLVLASPDKFASAFGEAPPHPEDGPHLAGLTIGCRDLGFLAGLPLNAVGDRLILPASRNFGTVLAFAPA